MNTHSQEQFKTFLLEKIETFTKPEKDFIRHLAERKHVARNTNMEFDERLTLGQRVADKVATFGGSWTFIIIFAVTLAVWIIANSFVLANLNNTFDPFPYILLNLILSMLAAIQAPVIMMSQNRQASKDRLDAAHDYEVNLKAELGISGLHHKLDELREQQWRELVDMQQEQIRLLTQLLEENKRGHH